MLRDGEYSITVINVTSEWRKPRNSGSRKFVTESGEVS